MPFDQNVGMGYAITLAIQIFAVLIIGGIICLINSLFFGICWYVNTFMNDLTEIFERTDELWAQKNDEKLQDEHQDDFLNSDSSKEIQTFSIFQQFFLFSNNIFR